MPPESAELEEATALARSGSELETKGLPKEALREYHQGLQILQRALGEDGSPQVKRAVRALTEQLLDAAERLSESPPPAPEQFPAADVEAKAHDYSVPEAFDESMVADALDALEAEGRALFEAVKSPAYCARPRSGLSSRSPRKASAAVPQEEPAPGDAPELEPAPAPLLEPAPAPLLEPTLSPTQAPPSYPAVPAPAPAPPGYSEEELGRQLEEIGHQLQAVRRDGGGRSADEAQLVERIRQATEALVWGEKHDSSLFGLFCEHRTLARLVAALQMRATPGAVKVQALQSLLILVQNARCATSFFYLLSGGHLNALFDEPPDAPDEETLAYFVALLKAVALRLDTQSAPLCLVRGKGAAKGQWRLPIFERAVHLANNKEAMVSTAARTTVLSLLRLEDAQIQAVTLDAFCRYLAPKLGRRLRAAWATGELSDDAELRSALAIGGGDEGDGLRGFAADLLSLGIKGVTAEMSLQLDEAHLTWLARGQCVAP